MYYIRRGGKNIYVYINVTPTPVKYGFKEDL